MKKLVIIAVAAVSTAMFALPAVASAGMWSMDPAGAAFNFTGNGAIKWTTKNHTFECTATQGAGSYNAGSTTEGTIELTLTGCKNELGSNCTTPGKALGEITTTTMTVKNVYLEPETMTPGITIKGAEGGEPKEHFATFNCSIIKWVVTGTILGQMEEPTKFCNVESAKLPFTFESIEAGVQKWQQVTTEGAKEDLTSTIGGTTETISLDATGFMGRAEKLKPTCPATE